MTKLKKLALATGVVTTLTVPQLQATELPIKDAKRGDSNVLVVVQDMIGLNISSKSLVESNTKMFTEHTSNRSLSKQRVKTIDIISFTNNISIESYKHRRTNKLSKKVATAYSDLMSRVDKNKYARDIYTVLQFTKEHIESKYPNQKVGLLVFSNMRQTLNAKKIKVAPNIEFGSNVNVDIYAKSGLSAVTGLTTKMSAENNMKTFWNNKLDGNVNIYTVY